MTTQDQTALTVANNNVRKYRQKFERKLNTLPASYFQLKPQTARGEAQQYHYAVTQELFHAYVHYHELKAKALDNVLLLPQVAITSGRENDQLSLPVEVQSEELTRAKLRVSVSRVPRTGTDPLHLANELFNRSVLRYSVVEPYFGEFSKNVVAAIPGQFEYQAKRESEQPDGSEPVSHARRYAKPIVVLLEPDSDGADVLVPNYDLEVLFDQAAFRQSVIDFMKASGATPDQIEFGMALHRQEVLLVVVSDTPCKVYGLGTAHCSDDVDQPAHVLPSAVVETPRDTFVDWYVEV